MSSPYSRTRAQLQRDMKSPVRFLEQLIDRRARGCASAGLDDYGIARRLPNLLTEKKLNFGAADKIFCSEWLSETDVLVGTKCNKLYVMDTVEDVLVEIPRLCKAGAVPCSTSSCGIHSVSASPDRLHVATGGHNPNYLAVYQLPQMLPLAVGETHTDWIFDIKWISDSLLITGSRDSSMALWSINGLQPDATHILAEQVTNMEPIFQFSNVPTEPQSLTTAGERVRSLAYNTQVYELGSLQANPCGAAVHFWDVFLFQQVSKISLPFCAENVCMEVDSEGTQLYAVGSRSHITFIDPREGPILSTSQSVKSPDKDCGVRSLNFNQYLLSVGTGAGHLYFYDLRTRSLLPSTSDVSSPCALQASEGWLKRDQTYRDFFSGLPKPQNAIYTHCYSPMKTKIFTAGGPLPLGLYGNYAAVWT